MAAMEKDNSNSPNKRKRDSPPTPPTSSPLQAEIPCTPLPMLLSTSIPGAVVAVDNEPPGSPRTKVAYNFQGLQLDDGGAPISKFDLTRAYPVDATRGGQREDIAIRKRIRTLKADDREIPESPQAFTISIGNERTVDPTIQEKASQVVLHNNLDPVIFKGNINAFKGESLHRAYPSINRLSNSTSKPPLKRLDTPPLFGAADAMYAKEACTSTDVDRAAMTWHDDEITGHDPSDPEDDGEGINGIGFRPTAAMAHARTAKRKQQMEAYRTREAREARERRSERRRASELSKKSTKEEAETARRVRFLEAESKSMMSIL
ncbi:hypothetical protein PVAG01_03130 [Phlyctema vagabunda]|uniref:Uncharacterized protein n=1 Tax=Phlyctema vagabunda TaxID=108571 RepID=A0ABR4PT17_9HELO